MKIYLDQKEYFEHLDKNRHLRIYEGCVILPADTVDANVQNRLIDFFQYENMNIPEIYELDIFWLGRLEGKPEVCYFIHN